MFRSLYSSLISSLNHAHPGVDDYQFLGLSHCVFIGDFISNSRSQLITLLDPPLFGISSLNPIVPSNERVHSMSSLDTVPFQTLDTSESISFSLQTA